MSPLPFGVRRPAVDPNKYQPHERLSLLEVCAWLGINRQTLWRWEKRGYLAADRTRPRAEWYSVVDIAKLMGWSAAA